MKRFGALALVMLTAVLLQTALLARYVTFFGITPDLVLIIVISLALMEGPTTGAAAGFGGGLLRDFLIRGPVGLGGLAHLLTGYAVGRIRPFVQSTSVFLPVAAVAVGTLAGTALYSLFRVIFDQPTDSFGRVMATIALTALYNTLLVPFVYPVVRAITRLYRKEQVYKW